MKYPINSFLFQIIYCLSWNRRDDKYWENEKAVKRIMGFFWYLFFLRLLPSICNEIVNCIEISFYSCERMRRDESYHSAYFLKPYQMGIHWSTLFCSWLELKFWFISPCVCELFAYYCVYKLYSGISGYKAESHIMPRFFVSIAAQNDSLLQCKVF